jgi:hypothetical protein
MTVPKCLLLLLEGQQRCKDEEVQSYFICPQCRNAPGAEQQRKQQGVSGDMRACTILQRVLLMIDYSGAANLSIARICIRRSPSVVGARDAGAQCGGLH